MFNQEVAGRRAAILQAALEVIAERGFRGASIKRIAARAGLKSPALIYWYFADKDALLQAVIDELAPFIGRLTGSDELLEQPPDVVLPQLVDGFLRTVQQPVWGNVMRLVLSDATRHPAVASFFARHGPLVVLSFLERYLRRQVELGRLRPHDCAASARAFMGMQVIYAIGRELFPALAEGFPPAPAYAQTVVLIFLDGLRPVHDPIEREFGRTRRASAPRAGRRARRRL